MALLFTSTYTILGLPRVLGVKLAGIILILKVIWLIVGLLALHLARGIAFRHIISHHVSSGAYQFTLSLVLLGLINTIGSNSWPRFDALLP